MNAVVRVLTIVMLALCCLYWACTVWACVIRRALAALRRRHPLTIIHPGESDSEGGEVGDDTLEMLAANDIDKLVEKWREEEKRRG